MTVPLSPPLPPPPPPNSSPSRTCRSLLASYNMKGFFEVVKKNMVMLIVLLLWRMSHDCHQVAMGYGIFNKVRLRGGIVYVNQLSMFRGVVWLRLKNSLDMVSFRDDNWYLPISMSNP